MHRESRIFAVPERGGGTGGYHSSTGHRRWRSGRRGDLTLPWHGAWSAGLGAVHWVGQKVGPAGFVKGGARGTLAPEGKGTLLTYQVDASVGGKIAQLGSRIIDGLAKKMAGQFFEKFAARVEGPQEPALAGAGAEAPKRG